MKGSHPKEDVPVARQHTVIYFLISFVVILLGLGITLWAAVLDHESFDVHSILFALGTSLFAAGLASLALGILRWMDDRNTVSLDSAVRALTSATSTAESKAIASVTDLKLELANKVILDTSSQHRCVDDKRIGEAFRTAFGQAVIRGNSQIIEVDVVGLKLLRFLRDQLVFLQTSEQRVKLRLLLQKPDADIFADICKLEGRDFHATGKEVRQTLNLLPGAFTSDQSLVWQQGNLGISLRLYSDYQPVTLFLIDNECYVRPRVSTPRGASSRFYERYDAAKMKPHFDVFKAHFQECWNESKYEPLGVISRESRQNVGAEDANN